MSTRGSTFWDDDLTTPDWVAEPKPWCKECCVSNCGCLTGEAALEAQRQRYLNDMHIVRGEE